MTMVRSVRLVAFFLLVGLAACERQPADGPPDPAIMETLESFYGAMKKSDPATAMSLIGPDALFVESGRLETRAEYEANHLPSDIEFESMVTGQRKPVKITMQGDTAWVIAQTDYDGTFQGAPVSFTSMQLAVLTRDSGRWMIRSIHWSSRPR